MDHLQVDQPFMDQGTVQRSKARICWLIAILFFANPLWAQLDNVMVYGTVKDMSTAKKLDGVTITVFKNGAKLMDAMSNASGKYEVNLDYGAEYKVQCSKQGYVGKNISIDTRNIPEEERLGGHGMNIDFTMMVEIEGVDYSVLKEPFGKAQYVSSSGNFEWDMEYTARMRDAQARLLKEYEDKKKREGNAEAEFAKQMELGNAAMTAKDFKKAVASFSSALELKPNEPVATAKLSDARMQLESQEGDKKREEQYAALIKEADVLFTKKTYAEAKAKYDAALDIKEAEAYPKQRIREIDVLLAELAKKEEEERKAKELETKYQAAVAAADASFKAEKWDDAVSKYTEAAGLKPAEKYPKDQLALVATKKTEAAAKAEQDRLAKELQEKYQAAIASADAAFKAGKWDDATTKYTEASGLKPEEKYPKDQLAAVAKKKEEEANKAEADRLAKELQEKYQAAITAADAAFKSSSYDVATAKYNEALVLKPEEKYPKDQLAAILNKLDEQARKAEEERRAKELDEQYKAVIALADAGFTGERWDEAEAKYTEAASLKPAEKYPKDQIAAIAKKKDDLARKADDEQKQKELDERYQAAIASADDAFGKEDWEGARTRYTEAGAIKSTEQYPKDQLAAIAQRIADAEAMRKQEELDAKYQGLIAAADADFDKEDYAAAKAKYQEASILKAQERYPKDRMAEADARAAEKARIADEERKRQELEARYSALIEKADKAYDKEEWSSALNDYKDALKLKPEESHPKNRISAIEQSMDAAAQAKAEEERLLRERQERDQRYTDLITAADKAFGAQDYTKAEKDYKDALEVKADEAHPKNRLAEIAALLEEQARKADEERSAAEREAAERERQAEADRLAAEAAAAEKARRDEEERMRQASAAEVEARYKELVAEGDLAFGNENYDKARERYTSALGVKPAEQYPKDRIAAIEAALNKEIADREAAERLAAEQRAAEEERLRMEQEAAEAARLAEMNDRQREEEERSRREREEAEERRLAEERERMEREGAKAIEERYRNTLASADEALTAKQYEEARGMYAQASDMKPGEPYPLSKIDQIDKLLAELERQRAEAELAAQRAREPKEEAPRKSTTIDMRKEQEAEQFMREAREREEAEKYERIKKLKAEVDRQEEENAATAADRRNEGVVQKERYQEGDARLFEGDQSRRLMNADELAAYREALDRSEAERADRAAEIRERSYGEKIAVQEQAGDRDRIWEQRQVQRTQDMAARTEAVQNAEARRMEAGREQADRSREELAAVSQRTMSMEERGRMLAEEKRQSVEEEKRAQQARETRYAQVNEQTRIQNKERVDALPPDQPRVFADHNRSKLAQDYPPGVTEESYTEGNKVIIRRVVVNGNRADEYSKVIAKWGTFYFKNGQSITEAIWARETE
jgi:hypothetical protein